MFKVNNENTRTTSMTLLVFRKILRTYLMDGPLTVARLQSQYEETYSVLQETYSVLQEKSLEFIVYSFC